MKHTCLNCKKEYTDDDVENYLCEACINSRKALAKQLDAQFNTVGQQPNSEWQQLKRNGQIAGGQIFIPKKRI